MSFTYDDNGIRTSKTVNNVKHSYYLNGSLIVAEQWSDKLIVYLYDSTGMPIGMMYRTTSYAVDQWDVFWFEKNLQGDVVAIYSSNGIKVATYKQLIATEFQRRESISNSVLNALSAGDNRRAYEILSSAVPFYPQCEQLLSCFEKTIFSMKCKLSFSPQMMQSKYYAPTVIPEAMSSCPSFVETLKSLQKR